jgi:predicted transcriptional regulator
MNDNTTAKYVDLTADIISAFVTKNSVQRTELPGLIASVHAALANIGSGGAEQAKEELRPAVPIKKSITPDYIICLDDGKKFKSLKRHLRTAYGLTPDQYRARWDLPAEYPMVAPNYAKARSELAKTMGLGQKRRAAKQRRKAA